MSRTGPNHDLYAVLERFADDVRSCERGSFRGVIKDGKIVIFAVEQEWRTQMDQPRAPRPAVAERRR